MGVLSMVTIWLGQILTERQLQHECEMEIGPKTVQNLPKQSQKVPNFPKGSHVLSNGPKTSQTFSTVSKCLKLANMASNFNKFFF